MAEFSDFSTTTMPDPDWLDFNFGLGGFNVDYTPYESSFEHTPPPPPDPTPSLDPTPSWYSETFMDPDLGREFRRVVVNDPEKFSEDSPEFVAFTNELYEIFRVEESTSEDELIEIIQDPGSSPELLEAAFKQYREIRSGYKVPVQDEEKFFRPSTWRADTWISVIMGGMGIWGNIFDSKSADKKFSMQSQMQDRWHRNKMDLAWAQLNFEKGKGGKGALRPSVNVFDRVESTT